MWFKTMSGLPYTQYRKPVKMSNPEIFTVPVTCLSNLNLLDTKLTGIIVVKMTMHSVKDD